MSAISELLRRALSQRMAVGAEAGGGLMRAGRQRAGNLGGAVADDIPLAPQQAQEPWPSFGELSPREAQLARAEALGFDTSNVLYHGTQSSFPSFRPQRGAYGRGVYVTRDLAKAEAYANKGVGARAEGANIVPVFIRRGSSSPTLPNDRLVYEPRDVRSIFAQFDPAQANSSDLLAGAAIGVPVGAVTLREALRGRMTGEA